MVVMHQLTFHFRAVCLFSVCIGLWINVLAVAVVCDCPLTLTPRCMWLATSVQDVFEAF